MVTEVKDQWCDPYPLVTWINGKGVRESELPVFATQVIDGKGYRIAVPPDGKEGFMRTYCIGPVKIADGKAVMMENRVTDNATNHNENDLSGVTKPVPKLNKGNRTTQSIVTHENNNFGTKVGRPKKEVDVEKIIELRKRGWNLRDIEGMTGVPRSTVGRILQGQRVLI